MDKTQLDEFFKLIKNNLDKFNQTDEITASIITTLIKDNLMEDLYDKIPDEINKLLETRDFSQALDITKKILVTYGIPQDIISNLGIMHLVKLIKSLKYFVTNKSTVSLYKIIASIFNDIYIAELYLTYDKQNNNVYLVPKWINSPPNDIKKQYEILDYDIVYNKIPELLITKQEWITQFQNDNATYPLMTNILLTVTNKSYNISLFNELISTIIYKTYYNNNITIYLDYKKFTVKFSDLINIYYYIFALFENISKLSFEHPEHVNTYISKNNIQFTINDIDMIANAADNITTKQKSDDFKKILNTYIKVKEQIQPSQYTIEELQTQLYINYPELVSYINSIYNSVKNNDIARISTKITLLNQLVNSILYTYSHDKYIQVFINTYFFIDSNNETISNKFVTYYKPINILILNNYIDYILFTIKDPLDNQYIEDFIKSISLNIKSVTITNLIRFILIFMQYIIKHNRVLINDIISLAYEPEINENININDKTSQLITSNQHTYTLLTRYTYHSYLSITKEIRYILNDIIKFIVSVNNYDELKNIADKIISLITTISVSNYSLLRYKHNTSIIKQTNPRYVINDIFFVKIN